MLTSIYYLVKWGKCKEKAWSGTYYSLYKALEPYFKIIDIDLTKENTVIDKIKLRLFGSDLYFRETKGNRKYVSRLLLSKEKKCVFQFAENIFDSADVSSYIYMDFSVSYVEYMMDYYPEIFAYSNFRNVRKNAIRRRASYQTEYLKNCQGIFTMGHWLAEDLVNRCGIAASKVHCVGGGINLKKELIDYSQKKGNKILFVGRDFERKGGFLVVEAFKRLKERVHNVELYVAGPAMNPIKENIEGYHYVGDCDYDKTAALFNLCDIFVMPSYFEAYGLVFIEALSFGLPVIARNAFEMPYFVEDGKSGLLLQKDDVDILSNMMERLLKDENIKSYVKAKREFYLSEYSWDKVANKIRCIIGEKSL